MTLFGNFFFSEDGEDHVGGSEHLSWSGRGVVEEEEEQDEGEGLIDEVGMSVHCKDGVVHTRVIHISIYVRLVTTHLQP